MSDPNVRHLTCPTCNTHAPAADGRFMAHPSSDGSGSNCPNTGRSVAAETGGARTPGSQFESCPAATGEALPPCRHFPDGAHRCQHPRTRESHQGGYVHQCTCQERWFSAVGDVTDWVKW